MYKLKAQRVNGHVIGRDQKVFLQEVVENPEASFPQTEPNASKRRRVGKIGVSEKKVILSSLKVLGDLWTSFWLMWQQPNIEDGLGVIWGSSSA